VCNHLENPKICNSCERHRHLPCGGVTKLLSLFRHIGQLLGLKIVYISGKLVMVICCLGAGNTPSATFKVSFFVLEISNHCVK
jgi:hypothetical protein